MVGSVGLGGIVPQFSWHKAPSFDELDANGDGSVTLDELKSAGKILPAGKSGDASTRAEAFLKRLDKDGNGSVSKDELAGFQSRISDRMQALMLRFQEQTVDETKKAPGDTKDLFARIDGDGDGTITEEELKQFSAAQGRAPSDTKLAALFNVIDSNHDGKIDKDENAAFVQKLEARRSAHRDAALWAASQYNSALSLASRPGEDAAA
jgi:Ca2+-binding EF-hand superfamily protein